jgi:hypothetical protein
VIHHSDTETRTLERLAQLEVPVLRGPTTLLPLPTVVLKLDAAAADAMRKFERVGAGVDERILYVEIRGIDPRTSGAAALASVEAWARRTTLTHGVRIVGIDGLVGWSKPFLDTGRLGIP